MNTDDAVLAADRMAAVQAAVMHHVTDSHQLNLFPGIQIGLPGFLSVHGTMVVLAAVLLLAVFAFGYRRSAAVPRGLSNLLELYVLFIRDHISVAYLGPEDGRRMAPLFCSFFAFILTMNLLGLIPGLATATANISVTGALALVTLFFMIFGAIYRNGMAGFLKSFMPHGVPWPVLILLAPIEFAGQFIRAFALTIRLFANNLAGHIVLFSLLGLVVLFGWPAAPAVGLALGIYLLEIFVAVLQAYVFTLLSAIFISQTYYPSH